VKPRHIVYVERRVNAESWRCNKVDIWVHVHNCSTECLLTRQMTELLSQIGSSINYNHPAASGRVDKDYPSTRDMSSDKPRNSCVRHYPYIQQNKSSLTFITFSATAEICDRCSLSVVHSVSTITAKVISWFYSNSGLPIGRIG